jgi:nicotinamidase-related amidase
MTKRILRDQCLGVIIDVQDFFLAQVERRERASLEANIGNFARLLGYFKIPVVATLERPVEGKGTLPYAIKEPLNGAAQIFEKDFFDLTKEAEIRTHLQSLQKKQAIIAGCETDVCVLQSCLGLLDLGYEVFVVEELLFSSTPDVDAAMVRMETEGAVFLTYKTLYYELLETVGGGTNAQKLLAAFGDFPDDLPDCAV